jgi:putative oxidoreductase
VGCARVFPDGGGGLTGTTAVAVLILRVFVGTAILLHGYLKLFKIPAFSAKFNLPVFVGGVVVLSQVIGGSMLLMGLLTRLACFAVGLTMAGAIFKCIARGERFVDAEHHSWESAGFYLISLIVIGMLGPGEYSLDRWLF